jgi:hypothetical protein
MATQLDGWKSSAADALHSARSNASLNNGNRMLYVVLNRDQEITYAYQATDKATGTQPAADFSASDCATRLYSD